MESNIPSLTKLQSEADSIRTDLNKATELLTSCNERLNRIVGDAPQKGPQKALRMFIKNVLNTSNEPLTVREITELVLEAGYKTSSTKNFRNIVQQTLINDAEFKRKTKPKTRPARYALEEV